MPDPIPPSKQRDEETLRLIQYFFAEMCQAEGTPPEKSVEYLPEYLLEWIFNNLGHYDRDQVKQQIGVSDLALDFLTEILRSTGGPLMLAPVWPLITMAHRGDPRHRVKLLSFSMLITWDDGVAFPVTVSLPAEMMEGGVINDAFLGSQVAKAHGVFMRQLVEDTLDGMHDKYGTPMGGDYPFEVLMGSFLKIIPQLKPELHDHLKAYMRLIQSLLRPALTPQAKQRLEYLRAKRRAADQPPPDTPGGWDLGPG